jgi:hypothetical protein
MSMVFYNIKKFVNFLCKMYVLAKIKDNLPPELFAMFSCRSVRYPQSSSVACSKINVQYNTYK